MRITQKAYAACVADFEPCLKALLDQVTGLDREEQLLQWGRIKYLMADEFTTTRASAGSTRAGCSSDYELVKTYLGIEKPFAVESAFTSRLLDPAVKMDASKVRMRLSGARRPTPDSHKSAAHRRRTRPWS